MNLHSIVHAIQDGILIINREGIVERINEEYTKITGVEERDIIGKPLLDVRPEAQLIRTLHDENVRVGVHRNVNGREYVVDMAPIYENGVVVGAVSVCKGKEEVFNLMNDLKKKQDTIDQLEKKVQASYQATYTFESIVGHDLGLKDFVQTARKAAAVPFPVLLTGESGTGKELFAQAIHRASDRADKPFVPINCATIPADLMESELFGYTSGAFTSAKHAGKIGLFELATDGTLFLDEIGELPVTLQSKLLRVLQEGTIRKVGALKEQHVNTRIIAATNRNIGELVARGGFREDLYYRLGVLNLHIPPLRERKQDLEPLVRGFLQNMQPTTPIHIEPRAFDQLAAYDWPGNVRELHNVLQFSLSMMDRRDTGLHTVHLPAPLGNHREHSRLKVGSLRSELNRAEYEVLSVALKNYENTIEGKRAAAQQLNISLATLYNKLKKHGMNP
ncbi:LOW QUALITY PROTEIN: hypothetical protein JCM19039_3573 [Geomicrobium sp. JCM 19039]|nr:LOW QUALITY PROTEIN: hypothetical protein JCM19039_3573 [Geomicrobium sp. JCM 19039]